MGLALARGYEKKRWGENVQGRTGSGERSTCETAPETSMRARSGGRREGGRGGVPKRDMEEATAEDASLQSQSW